MGTYKSAIYGLPLYGARPTTNYYDSGISAWAYEYNTVFLKWNKIVYNPSYNTPTQWRLTEQMQAHQIILFMEIL
jgi:hypothetical protein